MTPTYSAIMKKWHPTNLNIILMVTVDRFSLLLTNLCSHLFSCNYLSRIFSLDNQVPERLFILMYSPTAGSYAKDDQEPELFNDLVVLPFSYYCCLIFQVSTLGLSHCDKE